MNPKFTDLKNRLYEIHDLRKAAGVLDWDRDVMMPPKGSAVRAEQLATLERIAHEKFIAPEMGKLLDELQAWGESQPYDSFEASLIRVTRRDYEKQVRVPSELSAEIARTTSIAMDVWAQARKQSDFKMFLPHLEKNVALLHKYVECFDEAENIYDLLLDDYERGMKTSEVTATFDALKKDLVPLIAAIGKRADAVNDQCLRGNFPKDKQREFCISIVSRFGWQPDSWRLDPTVHPFATSFSPNDIRITTRYYEDFINPSVFGSMHECGHGLYENGVDLALQRTPLCRGASSSLHESQSRMWENLVGRSRSFWKFFYPRLQETFPDAFKHVEMETFYRAVNKVQPSFIRVEADEATYALHIILRFELEQEIMNGKLALRDLPEAWNARMKSYLGIDVPRDAEGVLQDVHWSGGMMGYFPTYSLGNIISAQIWEKILADMPDLYSQFERGEFMPLREWLREHLHKHGRKFAPRETLQKVVGDAGTRPEQLESSSTKASPRGEGGIDVVPYVRYLKNKFGEIYNIS